MVRRIILYPVNEKALLMRISRKLAAEGKGHTLRKARCGIAEKNLGRFFLFAPGRILETHVDPAEFARELGVLQPWEELVDDDKDDEDDD